MPFLARLTTTEIARTKILPVSIPTLKWAVKTKRMTAEVQGSFVRRKVRCSSQVLSTLLRHSGDLPRSVQRRRRPSKQVWRWKKHVITWLLFLRTREATHYTLGGFSQYPSYELYVTCLSTPILGSVLRVSCKSTRMYNHVWAEKRIFNVLAKKSKLLLTNFPSLPLPTAS